MDCRPVQTSYLAGRVFYYLLFVNASTYHSDPGLPHPGEIGCHGFGHVPFDRDERFYMHTFHVKICASTNVRMHSFLSAHVLE